jgi:hypothetical protein
MTTHYFDGSVDTLVDYGRAPINSLLYRNKAYKKGSGAHKARRDGNAVDLPYPNPVIDDHSLGNHTSRRRLKGASNAVLRRGKPMPRLSSVNYDCLYKQHN